uniref:Uncharacterized protein n=1 Tax=Chromera velia CCMP2878 TaxID=1169474 RepID=A0A0G4FLH0_9ALVE|eukprot:Cvel_17609.t1-p1 / transcript=Cvel_17609.t1 / gene=Cvel_17609 / organism=Chromera_velia_CCMP2878 / gene_product=hypothetical protein / transcript_product=hypothetical protein / location=Cvel_scaffold1416:27325-27947(-) / protein_length=88 / sequence_SO=supercontig / SO=protein_coding / is_pseudo=false
MNVAGQLHQKQRADLSHCALKDVLSRIAARRAEGSRFVPVTPSERAVKVLMDNDFTVWNPSEIQPVSEEAFWQAFEDACSFRRAPACQ